MPVENYPMPTYASQSEEKLNALADRITNATGMGWQQE